MRGQNVYILVDDRSHEPQHYAFSSWMRLCKRAAELIMDKVEEYPKELQEKLKTLFLKDQYEETLYVWREAYGWKAGKFIRTEVLKIDSEDKGL